MSAPMDQIEEGRVRLRVHGADADREEDSVPALVFAAKLATLVRAINAADKAVNGKVSHEIKIEKLSSSAPTALLAEEFIPQKMKIGYASGIGAFADCVGAILEGRADQARQYGSCVEHVYRLTTGARKKFEYAEVWVHNQIFRVDQFLSERSEAIFRPELYKAEVQADLTFFSGVAFGSFDGTVQVADMRGSLPAIKLVLSAGGKQLDCICKDFHVEKIRMALNRRVRVSGKAFYDGRSGLPRRIEVFDIEGTSPDVDFTKWKGSFEQFDVPGWEGDGE